MAVWVFGQRSVMWVESGKGKVTVSMLIPHVEFDPIQGCFYSYPIPACSGPERSGIDRPTGAIGPTCSGPAT